AEGLGGAGRGEPELGGGRGGGAGEAVARCRGDPRRERVGRAAAGDRDHRLVVERALACDVQREPVAEHAAVAEAGVDRVLEVRVRVDEPRQDHRAGEVTLGAARGDVDDPPVLPGDVCVSQRRAVDREHPVGGDRGHVSTAGPPALRMRLERRSSSTESQIEPSKRMMSGMNSKNRVTGSTPGSATATQAVMKYPRRRFLRSESVFRIPSRVRPTTKSGSSKTIAIANSTRTQNPRNGFAWRLFENVLL